MKALHVSRTANANFQMTINISVIFNYLRQYGPAYRAQISKDLKISAPAVSRAIDQLLETGYVIETGKVKTSSGKYAQLFSINLEKGAVIAVDLIGDEVRIGLFNFNGELIEHHLGAKLSESEDITRDLVYEINAFRRKVKHAPEIKAISIGVPAVADVERATVVAAFLYRNLQNLDFKSLLEEDLGATVYVENTVKLCALAEKRYGIAKEYKDIVFVDVSNGIGAGIIIENNLLRGAIGAAGEIGYAVLSPENLNFHVSDKGFLEKYASTESLKEKAVAAVRTGEQTVLLDQCYGRSEDITPVMVFEAALAGDPVSKRIVDEGINLITITVLNLILVLNPEIVVFGGDICSFPDVKRGFLEPIRRKIGELLPFEMPEIEMSALGEDAGIFGASAMAIESLLTGKYPYKLENEIESIKTG